MQALACAAEFSEDVSYLAPKPKATVTVIDGRAPRRKQGLVDCWLDHVCRRYAGQKRSSWEKAGRNGHEFGWSAASVMGKIKDERDGAGQGSFKQHYAEHFTQDALLVRRSIEGMPYDPYVVFHVYYIVPAANKVKFVEAGYAVSSAWDHLKVAHTWIQGRIILLDTENCLDKK